MAYYRAVRHFFAWSEHHQLGGLDDIEPLHIAVDVEQLQGTMTKPSVKQHLAAIRMLFDWLVTGGVLATNPAHAVRGPKHVVKREDPRARGPGSRAARQIDTSTLIGLRDRALIGVMTYAFARVGAVVAMRVEDYFANGKRWRVRLHEKGGKRHEMPARSVPACFVAKPYAVFAPGRNSTTQPELLQRVGGAFFAVSRGKIRLRRHLAIVVAGAGGS